MKTPAFNLPQLEQSIRTMLDKTGEACVELDTFLAAVEASAGKARWTLREMVEQVAKTLGAAFVLDDPPKVIRFLAGSQGRSASIRLDEFAYKPHVHLNTKPLFDLPSFGLPAPRSLLTITRADLEEAPVGWIDSMRAKLAAEHGVPVEQVVFDQMTHSDRAIFGEFRVRKAAPASPVV